MTARAPLVVKLFGEHAVVYGYHAIAGAINLKIIARVELQSQGYLIESNLGVERLESLWTEKVKHKYVVKALQVFSQDVLGRDVDPVKITIRSPAPPSCGLATSAAVSVAVISALSKLYNSGLSKTEIARMSHKVETLVQGRASPMDTYTSTLGGLVLVCPRENRLVKIQDVERLDLSIVLARRTRSTRELVHTVYRIYNRYREIVEKIFILIDTICLEALEALRRRDTEKLGMLMYTNHMLLSSLGVSNALIDYLISCLRERGARGAKLSGAGDGGTIVVLGRLTREIEQTAREVLRERYVSAMRHIDVDNQGVEVRD